MTSTDSAGDIGSVESSIASGNGLTATATAKAAVVDVSGTTLYFNGSSRKHEPFLSASLRARIQAKAQSTSVDSTLDNIKKVEASNIDDAAKVAIIDLINQSLAHHLNLESIMDKAVNTKVALFFHIPFELTAKEDRIRTCYMQACLAFVNFEAIANTDIRRTFGLGEKKVQATRIFKDTMTAGLVKQVDPDTSPRNMRYVPYWA